MQYEDQVVMKSNRKNIIALMAVLAIPASAMAQSPTSPDAQFVTQQPAGESHASMFVGQDVTNITGEKVGDIRDLLIDKSGRITLAVIGVGGLLGLGEKYVAIPFSALTITSDAKGERVVTASLSKAALQNAPAFVPTEKTTFMKAREKAGELMDQAGKKIEEMRREEPKQ
jgi:sporulation protein YlmC with PRC-barrel domain